jgi:putative tricarboxylic transport membrane protein
MKTRDWAGSLCWLVVGCAFCAGAVNYKVLRAGIPGAGFFPLLLGILLVILSLLDFISTLYEVRRDAIKRSKEKFSPHPNSLKKVLYTVGALFVYGLVLEHFGFLVTNFLFILFLLRFVDPQKWAVSTSIAFAATAISYVIFNVWLRVQLPKGILGI